MTFVNLNAPEGERRPIILFLKYVCILVFLSCPLSFMGSLKGFKRPRIAFPVRTNQIPRQVPEKPTLLQRSFSILAGGVLPFSVLSVQLMFVVQHASYFELSGMYGFILWILILVGITSAEVSVLKCYFQLCHEDYHWWWRSFMTPAATGFYILVAGVLYSTGLVFQEFYTKALYFGILFAVSFIIALINGTIGLVSSFIFVRNIYSSIKTD